VRWAIALVMMAAPFAASARTPEVEQTNWRYDEDWSVLRDAPAGPDAPWWRPVKYVPLGADGDIYASFGLEARARQEGFRNNLWGGGDAPDDGYLWLRLMPHMDLHVGPVRAFVQPIIGKARGVGAGAGPADTTGIDMLQSFADLRLALGNESVLTLRVGRALMPLGSERLVGIRYGPNIPQAFDGARLMLDHGPIHAEWIAAKPVAVGPGDLDDRTSDTKRLRGIYTTTRIFEALSIDAYWLDYRSAFARFAQGAGDEDRDTFGLRVFGGANGWAWNWEAMLQRGRFGADRIRAWSLATETSYHFADSPLKPRIRLRANIASGDHDPDDDRLGTFNPMFPKGKYFGELSPIGPYNIANIHPSVDLTLGNGFTLDVAGVVYWRASRRDGVYDLPGQLIRDGDAGEARFIGTQAEAIIGWQVDETLSFTASYSLFRPGAFIRQSGPARTIHMVGAEAMVRF
jgi:hypothetical protein